MIVLLMLAWFAGLFFALSIIPSVQGLPRYLWLAAYGLFTCLWIILIKHIIAV